MENEVTAETVVSEEVVEENTALRLTRYAVKMVVGIGASKIAGDIIRFNTAPATGKVDFALRYVGAYAIGGATAKAAEKHVDEQIDSLINLYKNFKKSSGSTV